MKYCISEIYDIIQSCNISLEEADKRVDNINIGDKISGVMAAAINLGSSMVIEKIMDELRRRESDNPLPCGSKLSYVDCQYFKEQKEGCHKCTNEYKSA